uniref:Uncharacterized protein n=1 Tax=Oryza rufipogon TaxID=4529 RepID=A0A0E0QHC8_ORYRU
MTGGDVLAGEDQGGALGKAAQLAVGCGAVEVCDHPVPVGSVKRHAPTPLDWANDAADVG